MQVYVYFVLIKLLQLTTGGSFSVVGGLTLSWYDTRLAWDKNVYNITAVDIPANKIWTPNLSLLNGVAENLAIPFDNMSTTTVFNYGLVSLNLARQFQSSCRQDLYNFPYDTQSCSLIIQKIDLRAQGGVSHDLAFVIPPIAAKVNTEIYSTGGEFTYVTSAVTSGSVQINLFGISCPSFTVTMTFKRNPLYYTTTIVLPSVLLLFLLALIFFLPSDNGAKIAMSCSLMISLYVLQQAVARILPTTSYLPLFSIGMMIVVGLGCYSVVCAVILVALRATQPPLSSGCVRIIAKFEPLLFRAARLPTNKVAAALTHQQPPKYDSASNEQNQQTSVETSASTIENAALKMLVQSHTALLQRMERTDNQQQDAKELIRQWKTLDLILNMILLLIYLIVACVSVPLFLCGGAA